MEHHGRLVGGGRGMEHIGMLVGGGRGMEKRQDL